MTQLRLPLGLPEPRENEFIVGESNMQAVRQLERWATWPVSAALLVGPRKSGRSTLARLFAQQSAGRMIDDAERVPEAELFHAWNQAQAERHPLLIVADAVPPVWQVRLPDLRSRLAATPVLEIAPPDDALMERLLRHYFDRYLLHAKPDVVTYIAQRIERSHVALHRVADALDAEASAQQSSRRLSIPVVRATLDAAGLLVEPS
ncbi:MAG: chromosomal replication initiator DnaA [Pseudomonadota bacterium]